MFERSLSYAKVTLLCHTLKYSSMFFFFLTMAAILWRVYYVLTLQSHIHSIAK